MNRDLDFAQLWDAAPALMRKRAKSKAKVWPEWVRAKRHATGLAIVTGFLRYKALDADLPRTGGPGLHIWLKDRTWEEWLEGSGESRTAAWTDAQWTVALRLWRESGQWSEGLGPPPGSPGCRVPSNLIVSPVAGAAA